KLYGFRLVADIDIYQQKSFVPSLVLVRDDQSVVASRASKQVYSIGDGVGTPGIIPILSSLTSEAESLASDREAQQLERQLDQADRDLPELEKTANEPFPGQEELAVKRERLRDVIQELDGNADKSVDSPAALLRTGGAMGTRVRGQEAGKVGSVSLADAEEVVRAITVEWSKGAVKRTQTVAAFSELPAAVQNDVRNAGGNERIRGVLHVPSQTVYVIAGNHSTLADLEQTVFHEAYGHLGL